MRKRQRSQKQGSMRNRGGFTVVLEAGDRSQVRAKCIGLVVEG
jgi:hypothetical protein